MTANMLEIIKNYNRRLAKKLIVKASEPEEWYKERVERNRKSLLSKEEGDHHDHGR